MSKELILQEKKRLTGLFTKFMDMHSGGGCKLGAEYIYIQADEDDATAIFKGVFDIDPYNVTCDCCGEDYSIYEKTNPEIENGSFVMFEEDVARYKASLTV